MNETLHHRGPDSHGYWTDTSAGVALGHRRLAIVDLSDMGHQPMRSSCSRMVITYNGEIYNSAELRKKLEESGRGFKGNSDTEVLLEACAEWGVERAVSETIGMFAFALWDREARCLYLARDRLGIKPLFFGLLNDEFFFGSELKAMIGALDQAPPIDHGAVRAFMRHGYVPTPHSIFKGVQKLEPGCILTVTSDLEWNQHAYWKLGDVIQQARRSPAISGDDEAVEELEELLSDSVKRRMVADVPLGAFLSGGIDSSTVVALMQSQSDRPVRTFSIGFASIDYDEAKYAKSVARHLGTDHTELYVEPAHAFDVIPKLADIYCEPFADSSQIPTYLVSELTRRSVTVSLSGDGGDELFAGYNRYLYGAPLMKSVIAVPRFLRSGAANMVHRLRQSTWDALSVVIPRRVRPRQFGDKMYKLADVITRGPEDVYRGLVSLWNSPGDIVNAGQEPHGPLWDPTRPKGVANDIEWMQYLDTLTYLPDDILAKVDRASMAVSLEARVPLLDHRIVEFAWRIPEHMKVRDGATKWILRQVLNKYVPKELVERPKMGFGVPIDSWLRGPLRDWAETLLDPRTLSSDGLINPGPVRRLWQEHLEGNHNWQYLLWAVLMFQAWRSRWLA